MIWIEIIFKKNIFSFIFFKEKKATSELNWLVVFACSEKYETRIIWVLGPYSSRVRDSIICSWRNVFCILKEPKTARCIWFCLWRWSVSHSSLSLTGHPLDTDQRPIKLQSEFVNPYTPLSDFFFSFKQYPHSGIYGHLVDLEFLL